jgi:hypothetical protein
MVAEVQYALGVLLSVMPSLWCALICVKGTNLIHPVVSGSGKEETLDFVAISSDVMQFAVCIFSCADNNAITQSWGAIKDVH